MATKKAGKKKQTVASRKVEGAMHEMKRGKLRSGSGKKVRSRKQAIAIGMSQARKASGGRSGRRKGGAKKRASS
jgi:hypothetical protein